MQRSQRCCGGHAFGLIWFAESSNGVIGTSVLKNVSGWVVAASGVGTLLVLGLFAMRLMSNVSLFEPLQLQTSGFEQESLYAIWKYINSRDVYTFTTEIPYTFSNFNWLYYVFYGALTGIILDLMGLADTWLPTVTRSITILGAAIGAFVANRTMRSLSDDEPEKGVDVLALGLSILVFFGPLAGFWTMTTRPDIWTTVIEAMLILGFLRLYPASVMKATLWALVLGYGAWAFKTIDITVAMSVGVFLLWGRHWLSAGVLAVGTLGSWVAAYALGTDAYQFSMLGAHREIAFSIEQGVRNLANFGIKMLPVLLPGMVIAWLVLRGRSVRQQIAADWQLQFLLITAVCGLGVSILGGFKVGGAENYFFTPSLVLALLVYKIWQLSHGSSLALGNGLKVIGFSIVLGWALTGAATVSVIVGINGVISQRSMHDRVSAMQPCLAALPQPIFVNDMNLSLPWITPSDQHFLLSFYYYKDRSGGRVFENDGIGGLIKAGYFNSLVFRTRLDAFDGASLDQYDLKQMTCEGWVIYQKGTP